VLLVLVRQQVQGQEQECCWQLAKRQLLGRVVVHLRLVEGFLCAAALLVSQLLLCVKLVVFEVRPVVARLWQ
jgi:hypothetical protein